MADQTNPQGQGAGQGTGGKPAGGQPPAGTGQDLSGIMEENVDISSLIANAGNQQTKQDFIASVKIPPHPNTTFNEKLFVELLAGSISLTLNEKYKIIQAIPQLSQFQVDELIKIFQEEQQKFSELEKKHAEQVAELGKQHAVNPEVLQAKAQEDASKSKEQAEADALRKSLGL